MKLLDYVGLNIRHFAGKGLQAFDDYRITHQAEHGYRNLRVPAWDVSHAERIRDPASPLSRLLASNEHAVADGNRILDGWFRIFGATYRSSPGFPDWSRDYLSGHRYPLHPYSQYEIEPDTGTEIISPWELSHLALVPTLVGASTQGRDTRYADFFFDLLADWQRANPYLIGVNWVCGLDVAIRAVNIALGIVYFGKAGDARSDAAVRLLWAHLVYLQKRDLHTRKVVVNNHQLVAAVLHYALLHLFDAEPATAWRASAREIVAHEVPRQFHADGGNFESALGYHQFVLESLYVAAGFLAPAETDQKLSDESLFPRGFADRLRSATKFCANYVRAWGAVPHIGDASDGRILYHRDYFSWTPEDASYIADWDALIFPGELRNDLKPGEPSAVLQSGLGMFSGTNYGAIFCAMPVDQNAGGHNHLDKTSLILRVQDQPVFVDSGTFRYTSDLAGRKYHRAGRAHNVLLVDAEDPASFDGPGAFEIPRVSAVGIELSYGEAAEPIFTMWHDGYRRLAARGTVTRQVHCLSNRLRCVDSVEGAGPARLELIFNLAPGVACKVCADGALLSVAGVHLCTVRPDVGWSCSTEPAWYSPSYGERTETLRLVLSTTANLPCEATTFVDIGLPE